MNLLRLLVSRRWLLATLLVLLGMGIMLRLAVWQIDRLQERRAANALLRQSLETDVLLLQPDTAVDDPAAWKDRRVRVTGAYDFGAQIGLKVQNWQGQPGIHLVTPLVLADGQTAVLVDRGWIPDSEAAPENWPTYDEPGVVSIEGYVALTQTLRRGNSTPPATPQQEWYRIDIAAIQPQMPYRLLPFYLLQAPPPTRAQSLPYRSQPEFDLSEGPHLGYAIQWVLFTLILGGGYLAFVRRSEGSS